MRSLLTYPILILLTLSSCSKPKVHTSGSRVSVKYTGEEQALVVETVRSNYDAGKLYITAEGFDHEELTINITNIPTSGMVPGITEKNISFTDGLDFESTRLEHGYICINENSNGVLTGSYKALLLDNINGVEHRWIEGDFKVITDRYLASRH